ncbi:MAG: RIP metalloprotease RseP [Flavobacteriales bacterium]|nr:RIP metalloprotease RseP [Flavobacteriales bacterium]
MDGLVMTAQLLLGLSILVVLHEGGHFLAARLFGMRVEKFYLFFDAGNFSFFKFQKGDTEYGVGWLPLGGYVKIAGMIDESMDKDAMAKPPEPWEFRSKPAWQRLIVMIGGVTVNVLLGMLIFSLSLLYYGREWLPSDQVKNGIVAHELAQEIGLQTGDNLLSINGSKVERFMDFTASSTFMDENVILNIDRNGQRIDIPIPDDFLMQLSKDRNYISPRQTFYVANVAAGSNAEKSGLLKDDVISSFNGEKFRFFDEFKSMLMANKGAVVELGVLREGGDVELKALVGDDGLLGFNPATNDFEYVVEEFGIVESFAKGSVQAWTMLILNIKGIGKLFQGQGSVGDSVAGPIGIAQIYGGTWNWQRFWGITAILSMILAFMNILPIPALDGGHVLFLSIEAITGKTFSDKFMERTQIAGMVFLLSLMVLIIGNDIRKVIESILM